jgi:hypothetical protein
VSLNFSFLNHDVHDCSCGRAGDEWLTARMVNLVGKCRDEAGDGASTTFPSEKEGDHESALGRKMISEHLCYCQFHRSSGAIEPMDWMSTLFVK